MSPAQAEYATAEVAIKRIENSTWQRSGWVCPVGAAWCELPDLPTLLLPNLVSLCDRPTWTTNTSARTLDKYQNSCFHSVHLKFSSDFYSFSGGVASSFKVGQNDKSKKIRLPLHPNLGLEPKFQVNRTTLRHNSGFVR